MKKYFKFKKTIIALSLFILSIFISAGLIYLNFKDNNIVRAGAGDYVTGFAWSENAGWISFNSIDCDIDGDGTFEGAGEDGGPAPAGCPESGAANNYGVTVDLNTFNFSGYGWSEDVGWISFEDNDPPDFDFSSNCNIPTSCDASDDNCSACYNTGNNNVYGWAKIESLGDDGWIKLQEINILPASGLELYQSFNTSDISGSTAYDTSGNGNDGTITGATATTSAQYDEALEFNGDPDCVEIADIAGLNPAQITVSGWFKTGSTQNDYASIMGKADNYGWFDGYGIYFGENGDSINFFMGDLWENRAYAPFVSDNKWHHVLGTFDGTTVRIYLDGVEGAPDSDLVPVNASSNYLRIGCSEIGKTSEPPYPPLAGYFFDGVIDEVRIYSRVLTYEERRLLYLNGVRINSSNGDFFGWGWNSSGICVGGSNDLNDCDCTADCANDCPGGTCEYKTGAGWVSFNCRDYEMCSGGADDGEACTDSNCSDGSCIDPCASSNYKVHVNFPPTVVGDPMAYPGNWLYSQACAFGALQAQLTWTFSDPLEDSQAYYQIAFNDADADPDTLVDNPLSATGLPLVTPKTPGAALSFWPNNNVIHRNVALDYGKPYYWWVKVWDDEGADSGWVQFDDPADTDGDGNTKTFTTYEHEFPDVYFSYFPEEPSEGETALFTDSDEPNGKSQYYTSGASSTDCDDSNCTYEWTQSSDAVIDNSTASTTEITINTPDPEITLKITDPAPTNYYCTKTKTVGTNVPLPTWKEIKP